MNKKMIKIAKKIDKYWAEYVKEYRKHTGDEVSMCLWIKNNETGEVSANAINVKELKKVVKWLDEE